MPIYLDNHATTRVDPRVVDAMLPYFSTLYGNAGSSHALGSEAKAAVDAAREEIAAALGAQPREIVFTSGATESNNLAILGVAARLKDRGRHLISVATEHPSVLDPLQRLATQGFDVTLLPVAPQAGAAAGLVDPAAVEAALRDDTILVSVMLANNEIGVIQPLAEIAACCRRRGVAVHTDATQAVGKIPLDVERLGVDLASFSAHKLFGPKGCGALYVGRRTRAARPNPILHGGGQQGGLRSGTLNVPGIVGLARALSLCQAELAAEGPRLAALRDRLYRGLTAAIDGVHLNGPPLAERRLPGNLNVRFAGVDGESLLLACGELLLSSGAACSAEKPEPSHVLRALGLTEEEARSSLRFGLGRFNTEAEIDAAVGILAREVGRLRLFRTL